MAENILASVAVLTFNAQKYLKELLDSLAGQETDFEYEVILIDSGSSDDTMRIAREYPIRLYEIENQDFSHGGTRNFAVSLASGEFIAFITQDAVPADKYWLQELVSTFYQDEKIAGVFGRQIARSEAFILTKRDMASHFAGFSPDNETIKIQYKDDVPQQEYQRNRFSYYFFSNVNSCVRRSVWEKIPFRKIDYAEDQALGMDLIEAGYKKAYNPKAAVIHSHDYRLTEYLKRQFDEFRGLKNALGYADPSSFFTMLKGTYRGFRSDLSYITGHEGPVLKDIYRAFFLNCYRMLGIYLGSRHEKIPVAIKERLSLEKSMKKKLKHDA